MMNPLAYNDYRVTGNKSEFVGFCMSDVLSAVLRDQHILC